ncbi:hypothetical protein HZS_6669, partial [Henneguya salminicola]
MSKIVQQQHRRNIFNFDVYKNFVVEYVRKIESQVDDQIKCLHELENQVENVMHDDKTCIFSETPSQQRKRLFVANDLISSSPLKDRSVKTGFQSVLRQNTVRLTHFEDDEVRKKLDFGPSIENSMLVGPNANATKKRRVSARLIKGPPIKMAPKLSKQKLGITSSFDDNSSISSLKNIDEKKEKRRLQMAAVEQRRKRIEEERRVKLAKREQEKLKKEINVTKTLKKPEKNQVQVYASPFVAPNPKVQKTTQLIAPKNHKNAQIHKKNVETKKSNKPLEVSQQPEPETQKNDNNKENESRRNTFDLKYNSPPKLSPNNEMKNYTITPEVNIKKPTVPPLDNSYTSYDIMSLQSDDTTDDDDAPSKPIPLWAQDKLLWRAVLSQHKDVPINGEEVFGPMPDITTVNLFTNPSARYYERTSSAFW